jgi:hypothetical protein
MPTNDPDTAALARAFALDHLLDPSPPDRLAWDWCPPGLRNARPDERRVVAAEAATDCPVLVEGMGRGDVYEEGR